MFIRCIVLNSVDPYNILLRILYSVSVKIVLVIVPAYKNTSNSYKTISSKVVGGRAIKV